MIHGQELVPSVAVVSYATVRIVGFVNYAVGGFDLRLQSLGGCGNALMEIGNIIDINGRSVVELGLARRCEKRTSGTLG